ncbi:MAG: alpha/beta hydrolase, partial [Bacteroidales bacterium]|nr:alpha/beta hydrolase [Bacteroidales bacterium]
IFVNGWSNSDMLKALVAEGYICLVYSNRGHGQSSYIEDRQELINDPKYLANDLRGAMTYLTGHELVMADSIGLMGGSMGASMAVAGNGYERVLTSVALSPANLHINYMFPGIPPRSVFYLVGENDIVNTGEEVINFPVESNALYKLTNDPRKIMILEGSIAHGTELLEQIGVKDEILLWFQTQLPVIH